MRQIIIELSDDESTRAAAAVGAITMTKDSEGAPRPATDDEVDNFVHANLRATVLQHEDREALANRRASQAADAFGAVAAKVKA